jgi:hypothetical protein
VDERGEASQKPGRAAMRGLLKRESLKRESLKHEAHEEHEEGQT